VQVHNRFLAESCSIADYNNDGVPDVSSGRRWFEGPDFITEHIFRDGHEDLPRDGLGTEIDTGVSDDYADFAWDLNDDGFADIINISNPEVPADRNPNPAPAPQDPGTAYWYENPGANWEADPMWPKFPLHLDVRHEQHALTDVDGDGRPELIGACKECPPKQTRGYYFRDWTKVGAAWGYAPVTKTMEFPFNGSGWMHGIGFNDVNGDGLTDMLLPTGAWLQTRDGTGWQQQTMTGTFYDGDLSANRGGAHMYAWDIDGDGDQDVFSADWAHGNGLAWYEQTTPGAFSRHQFMGHQDEVATYGVYFSQPHAAEVVDMDGDGVSDIVTGKARFANPDGCGDPDLRGTPVVYVFKTVRDEPGVSGAAHFEPYLVDDVSGVGRQFAVGHANTDGIMDICVGSKVGLYVFLGK